MLDDGRNWVIILAAGEGRRVRALTVDTDGTPIPKQFCPLEEGTSMLRWTVDRALRLADKRSFPSDRERCQRVRDQISEEIMEKGWSYNGQALVQQSQRLVGMDAAELQSLTEEFAPSSATNVSGPVTPVVCCDIGGCR